MIFFSHSLHLHSVLKFSAILRIPHSVGLLHRFFHFTSMVCFNLLMINNKSSLSVFLLRFLSYHSVFSAAKRLCLYINSDVYLTFCWNPSPPSYIKLLQITSIYLLYLYSNYFRLIFLSRIEDQSSSACSRATCSCNYSSQNLLRSISGQSLHWNARTCLQLTDRSDHERVGAMPPMTHCTLHSKYSIEAS